MMARYGKSCGDDEEEDNDDNDGDLEDDESNPFVLNSSQERTWWL